MTRLQVQSLGPAVVASAARVNVSSVVTVAIQHRVVSLRRTKCDCLLLANFPFLRERFLCVNSCCREWKRVRSSLRDYYRRGMGKDLN